MGERPPSPDFHGFESDTFIPGRLEIETRGTGDEERCGERGKGVIKDLDVV